MKQVLMLLIRAYQVVLSPFMGGACRFQPTCSNYGLEAIARFGACRGGWLTLKRLFRCRPFGPSGYDPVPPVWPGWRSAKESQSHEQAG